MPQRASFNDIVTIEPQAVQGATRARFDDVLAVEPDIPDTASMPNDESAFRQWYGSAAQRYGLNPDPDAPGQHYDYRAAFRADARPDASGHWPSDFKLSGHPNMVVGGFNVQTGERVPGTPQASEAELVRLGWDPETAAHLSRGASGRQSFNDVAAMHPSKRRSLLRRGWDVVNAPLLPQISKAARGLSERITNPSLAAHTFDLLASAATGFRSRPGETRGFIGGAIEGAGDVAASLTSPANLALAAVSGGAAGASRAGLTNAARGLHAVEAAAGGLYAAEGAHTVATAPDVAGKLMGVAEMAGGAAGVVHGGRGARGRTPITSRSVAQSDALGTRVDSPSGSRVAAFDEIVAIEPEHVPGPGAARVTSAADTAPPGPPADGAGPPRSTVEPLRASDTAQSSGGRTSLDEVMAIEPFAAEPTTTTPRPPARELHVGASASPEPRRAEPMPAASPTDIQPGGYYTLPPDAVTVDPARFQFKSHADAEGVTQAARIEGPWNENRAGSVLAWRDPASGELFVVNGHHRLEAAKRLGAPRIAVKVLDDMTAQDAKVEGALTNIAEDKGTPVDAAKVLRSGQYTRDELVEFGINPRTRLAREGLALSELSDPLFQRVAQGELEDALGVAIGDAKLSAESQAAVVQFIERQQANGRELTAGQVRALIQDVETSPEVNAKSAQGNMFVDLLGEERAQSVAVEKATLRDWLTTTLAKDRRLFGFVSKGDRAERLAAAGNVIDTALSKAHAAEAGQVQAVVEKLAFGKGPINDALNDAATRLAQGADVSAVRTDLLAAVRGAVETELRGSQFVASGQSVTRAGVHEGVDPGWAAATPEQGRVGDDIRELHGGLGIVGRMAKSDAASGVGSDAAPTQRRAVRTVDPETAASTAPPGKPMGNRQRLEGIKLDSFDDTVRPPLRDVLEAHDGFAGQRRDVQSWERTQRLAQDIEVDISSSLPKGRVLNAEETTAFANTLSTLTDRVTRLAAQSARGELDDIGRLGLEEARAAQVAVMQSLWGTVTEQGRALNAWKATKRVMETHDAGFIKQALEFVKDSGTELAPLLNDLGGDPVKQYTWLKDQARKKWTMADRLSSYYYANILSGVATHERNILSNSANLLFGLAADVGAGRFGQTRANLSGMWDALSRRNTREGPYTLALPRAFQEVYFHLQHGFSPTDVQMGKLDFGTIRPEFAGGGRNPFNWPARSLNAGDGFFRALVNQGERYRAAHKIAKQGAEGTFEKRMANALANLPLDVEREISEMTSRAVFQETPGGITRAFLQLRDTVPAMRYLIPFVRIVANLSRQSMEATPVGFAMQSARKRGRVGEAARAKAALGSVALLPIAYYAAAGRITGSGPSDPGERQTWLDSGKRPNSILNPVTGEWVNYMSWQPVALPMSLVANGIEAWRNADTRAQRPSGRTPISTVGLDAEAQQAELDAWTQTAMETVLRTGNSVMQQSFLSGVSGLMEALNDPERSANRFFTRLAQGFVPLAGAMRTATQMTDPVVRTPDTVREGVDAIIPGRSKTVAPLVDRFGQETEGTGHPLVRGFYQASPSKDDPLQVLLDYAGVHPQRPRGDLRDDQGPIRLTREEETALQKARGRITRAAYEHVQERVGANWQRVSSERLQDELTQAASRARAELTTRAKRLKRAGQTLTLEALLGSGRR